MMVRLWQVELDGGRWIMVVIRHAELGMIRGMMLVVG